MGGPRRSTALAALALIACAVIGVLAWAYWWPVRDCDDPACARKRFALFVELDAFQRTPELELGHGVEPRASLGQLLASGGIDLTLVKDQSDLPYDSSAGRLDRADLYQYATAWRSLRAPAGADAGMYAMVAPGLVADNGEPLFGLMFDYSGREGLAVAPTETSARFQMHDERSIPLLQLRTFAHELLHALNRSHIDAAKLGDGRLTVEAPTRCISKDVGRNWSLEQRPLIELSPTTIQFFQTAKRIDVLPGAGNTPYDLRRGSANECAEILAQPPSNRAGSRWDFAFARLRHLFLFSDAHADDVTRAEPSEDDTAPDAEVRIQALPTAYPLGYPIAVRLIVKNRGEQALPLRGRLLPGFGLMQIEVREKGEEEWRAVRPLAWYEPADDDHAMLGPGEWTEQTVPIYFGEGGWSFPAPGDYDVRARLRLGDDSQVVKSNTILIRVEAPRGERDQLVLQGLTTDDQRLDPDAGRMLAFGGRIGGHEDLNPIERAIREFPDTAVGSALRLTQASHELRPPIDPKTGKREAPNTVLADELLDDTCTDSGVAALRRALIMSHTDRFAKLDISREQEHEAWDGSSRTSTTFLRTYSDPTLELSGPTLHFCFDDDVLHDAARNRTKRFARELTVTKPERVVVIGHADGAASCEYNERLGLRRAESVKRALVQSGVRSDRIVTVSLGERRPLDFASTPEAEASNRRVEILIDGPSEERRRQRFHDESPRRIVPRCPDRATSREPRATPIEAEPMQ